MKGSGLIIAVILGIIIIGVVLGFTGNPSENKVVTLNENITVQNKQVNNDNKIENNINNVQNNQNENIESLNNEVISENNDNNKNNENVNDETNNEESVVKTDSERAIDIVKLDLGSMAQNVNITVDSVTNDGKFIISVREKDTTQAIAFYTVNINDKTFTKKEMY